MTTIEKPGNFQVIPKLPVGGNDVIKAAAASYDE